MLKNLFKKIKTTYNSLPLDYKIRYAYGLITVPMVIFLIVCLINIWVINQKYGTLIKAAGIASEFSLDFKKDFDYETYLVIVGSKLMKADADSGSCIRSFFAISLDCNS